MKQATRKRARAVALAVVMIAWLAISVSGAFAAPGMRLCWNGIKILVGLTVIISNL